MDWLDDPDRLWHRTKLGREEYMQRLLASLVTGAAASAWNVPREPTAEGMEFLAALHRTYFDGTPDDPAVFVDEFELPARHEAERAGWPDHAVLWPQRLFIIELKSERGSHRVDQLPHYLGLARHHYPEQPVDLLYLTPTMDLAPPAPVDENARYAWASWAEVAPLITRTWRSTDRPWEHIVATRLAWWVEQCEAGAPLPVRDVQPALPPTEVAATAADTGVGPQRPADIEQGKDPLLIALEVQRDGLQRALELDVGDPEELEDARLELRDHLLSGPDVAGTRITHVRPWIWRRATSGGSPLSEAGERTGYEIRLSRSKEPQVPLDAAP